MASNFKSLEEFLKSRNISNEIMEKIRRDNIDASVVVLMDDDQLKTYFPAYGDRIAIKHFCIKITKTDGMSAKKSNLIESLRKKLGLKKRPRNDSTPDEDVESTDNTMNRYGNKNAKKTIRCVEIGWLHRDKKTETYKQVRRRRGGGTRKLTVDKGSTKENLLEIGRSLFFPNGYSVLGSDGDFTFDLRDFQQNAVGECETVGDIYEKTKLPLLRFYIVTDQKIEESDDHTDSTSIHNKSPSDNNDLDHSDMTSSGEFSSLTPERTMHCPDTNNSRWSVDCPYTFTRLAPNSEEQMNSPTDFQPNTWTEHLPEITYQPRHVLHSDQPADEHQVESHPGGFIDLLNSPNVISPDETVQFGPFEDNEFLSDTLPENQSLRSSTPQPLGVHQLLVRRGYAMSDMIDAFEKETHLGEKGVLSVKRLLPNGELEVADDVGGVLRDTLSEFWEEFYTTCTMGTKVKVPFLRHDFVSSKWDAVGRIFKVGYKQCGYFPIKLAPSFIKHTIDNTIGILETDAENLMKDFLNFVNEQEKNILTLALESFDEVDQDDLMEVLEDYKMRRLPQKSNIKQTIIEMAEKELIQVPKFVIDSWSPHIKGLNIASSNLKSIYDAAIPNSKKVVSLIKFPENMSESQKTVSKYVLKFVKELDETNLKNFLRFITGADQICCKNIDVSFSALSGLSSRPISHTCNCTLELPEDYLNYPDFRAQFLNILSSNVWVMDFI